MCILVAQRNEGVRLLHLSQKGQVLAVVLGKEGTNFDARVGLEQVQLVHGRTLEVGPSHVVLVCIFHF